MSDDFQADVRAEILTGAGYIPDLMPAYQVDLETGIIACTCGRRSKMGWTDGLGNRGADKGAELTFKIFFRHAYPFFDS